MLLILDIPHQCGLTFRMSVMVMQTRTVLHLMLTFRPTEFKSLAYSHEYSFFFSTFQKTRLFVLLCF